MTGEGTETLIAQLDMRLKKDNSDDESSALAVQ